MIRSVFRLGIVRAWPHENKSRQIIFCGPPCLLFETLFSSLKNPPFLGCLESPFCSILPNIHSNPNNSMLSTKIQIHFFLSLYLFIIYLFGCLGSSLQPKGSLIFIAACRIFSCSTWDLVLTQDQTQAPLHWECGVLATGPGKLATREVPSNAFCKCIQT